MNNISPSILSATDKKAIVNELVDFGYKSIHYDLMDGLFVEAKSLSVDEIKYIVAHSPKHIVDIHVMCKEPEKYIEELIGVADYISFHYESTSEVNIQNIIQKYSKKVKLGIAINPNTSENVLSNYLQDLSFVLIMSVYAGKGGQKFIPEVLEKAKELKKHFSGFIKIDGGINASTYKEAKAAGVDWFVSGSFLLDNFKSGIDWDE